jgi:flagellar basal-body rod protein FlgF/flagellar basal-body rod protein FlgG
MYAALSGMSVKLQDIDRVATDLANVGTSGYKAERAAASAAERGQFRRELDSAIDVMGGDRKLDLRPGLIGSTGRDLDVALEGNGFFVVQTPEGERYTRDGGFIRRGDGVLTTRDGNPVMGQDGEIQIGNGLVKIGEDGTIRVGGAVAGRLKVVSFEAPGDIVRESGARFRAGATVTPVDSTARVIGGSLESANVSVVERMATLTSITRAFEGLQKGISIMANDIDGRAIQELGRR